VNGVPPTAASALLTDRVLLMFASVEADGQWVCANVPGTSKV